MAAIEGGRPVEQVVEGARVRTGTDGFPIGRDLHAGLLRQLFHGLAKVLALVLHQEGDRAAVGAAAEAMVELLLGADGEGGGLLVVKRATGLVVLPRLAQGDAAVDEVDDVDAGEQRIDEVGWDPAGHGTNLVTVQKQVKYLLDEQSLHPIQITINRDDLKKLKG